MARFFITDINNPAAGSMADSTLPVMFDAWADGDNYSVSGFHAFTPATQAVTFFNHVPGGSNVLYMDGHVEFVKYQSKYPVESPAYDGHLNLNAHTGWHMYMVGGYG